MGKFDGVLLCTDIDGTLLNTNRKVSQENKKALEFFKKEGGLCTFVTGRMPFFVSDIYDAMKPNAPFGCINGGGQPVQHDSVRNYKDLKSLRAKALYDADSSMKLRKSHESPMVKMLYDEYFDAPGKARAHKLLHTTYVKRGK